MQKCQIFGHIFPATLAISHSPVSVSWDIPELNGKASFVCSIKNSNVIVDVESTFDLSKAYDSILIRATGIAQTMVDVMSFAEGNGAAVFFDFIVDENEQNRPIVLQNPGLKQLCTAYGAAPNDYETILKIALEEPGVSMAFNDLIAAITFPHEAPVNCGRAIEGIRHLIAPGLEPKKQWPLMNEALRLDKTYMDIIRETSTSPRHGDRTHIPGFIVNEVALKSWTIMNRYLEYRKRNSGPLPQPEFPTLT